MAMPSVSESKTSSSTDVSTTNIQIAGVDEPDILKTNKDSYIYADAKHNKIYLVSSPLDRTTSTINLSNAKITSTILLPKQMQ
ncbi:beta-propeller domain-containing protein [Patescibacteria group bacterium]|nr:beta-propeller domain-containing protein [Patescibacteria group bacterium]